MGVLRRLAAAAIVLMSGLAHAGPYSDLIVFGDSLSDVGNVLGNPFIDVLLPIDDFENRFSNGPVYSERLSEGLGLGALVRSEDGGDNFANGGAETDGPNGFFDGATFIDSLVEQVDTYLARIGSAAPDPGTLFAVFIGANNLLDGRTDTAGPATDVRQQMQRLADAGARTFLGINLPKLGLTPRFGPDPTTAAARTATTVAYNQALVEAYDAIEGDNAGAVVHRLDVQALFNELIGDPTPLGFTNTTEEGQLVAGSSFDRAPGYVFWDDVHPTRELHALLGEAAIRAVLPAGDYDRDGIVSASDGEAWRDAYGTAFNASLGQTPSLAGDGNGDGRTDGADYTLWRDRLAETIPMSVPEPAAWRLLFLALAIPGIRFRLG